MLAWVFTSAILLRDIQSQECTVPQKGYYMSYNALSKRDTIGQMFEDINAKMPSYNVSYTNATQNVSYEVKNLKPSVYYNEHHQV